jgi:hypothetical protein
MTFKLLCSLCDREFLADNNFNGLFVLFKPDISGDCICPANSPCAEIPLGGTPRVHICHVCLSLIFNSLEAIGYRVV